MRIVHVSIADIHGGAARAAYRLHQALRARGHESTMFVMRKLTHDPDVTAFQPTPMTGFTGLRRRARRHIIRAAFAAYSRTRPRDAWFFSDDRTEHGDAIVSELPPADVINLHAVAGFIDHAGFFPRLPANVPIVWRLPEMSPFTGGCHYDGGCGRFVAQCGRCPQLGSTRENDLSRRIWLRKRASMRPALHRIHLVAPSHWVGAQARRSSLLETCPVTVIPNGLDVAAWCPGDRATARAALGLPADSRIVMFAAANTENRIKGYAHASAAMAGLLQIPGLLMLTVGHNEPAAPRGVPLVHLGAVQSDRLMRLAYTAADLFVMPSLEESFGQTAVEAMACGVPVVGFETGGIIDTVRHGTTGLLVAPGDDAALREALGQLLLDDVRRATMATEARRVAVSDYSHELQAERYERLYSELAAAAGRQASQTDCSNGESPA